MSAWLRQKTLTGTLPLGMKAFLPICLVALTRTGACRLPVEAADLEVAAKNYAGILQAIAGSPPVLDLVQLGSWTGWATRPHWYRAGPRSLDVTDTDVALTGVYQSRRRMTLTYPIVVARGTFSGW